MVKKRTERRARALLSPSPRWACMCTAPLPSLYPPPSQGPHSPNTSAEFSRLFVWLIYNNFFFHDSSSSSTSVASPHLLWPVVRSCPPRPTPWGGTRWPFLSTPFTHGNRQGRLLSPHTHAHNMPLETPPYHTAYTQMHHHLQVVHWLLSFASVRQRSDGESHGGHGRVRVFVSIDPACGRGGRRWCACVIEPLTPRGPYTYMPVLVCTGESAELHVLSASCLGGMET